MIGLKRGKRNELNTEYRRASEIKNPGSDNGLPDTVYS